MARYTATIPSTRSPADTFAYMADFTTVAEWDPSAQRATRLDDGPLRVGSQFEVVVKFLGREVELTYDLVEYAPDARRAVVRATQGGTSSIDTITVADDGAVTYDARLELRGPLRLLDPVMRLAFRRIGDNAARQLRSILN